MRLVPGVDYGMTGVGVFLGKSTQNISRGSLLHSSAAQL